MVTGEEGVLKKFGATRPKWSDCSDAGASTHKRIQDKTTYYEIPFEDGLQAELSHAIGRSRTTIAVMDAGLPRNSELKVNCPVIPG